MGDITRLLQLAQDGDEAARQALFNRVYQELTALARQRLAHESTLTELDAPSLVHEAYLRLARQPNLPGANRRMFFAYASRAMRSVVVDHVRARQSEKRGGRGQAVTLTTGIPDAVLSGPQLLAADRALESLRALDPRGHDLFELHFFGGMAVDEISVLHELSLATVKRDLRKARAFVFEELGMAAG